MLANFLHTISEINAFQGRYVRESLRDIKEDESQRLEHLLRFYVSEGNSVQSIAEKYLDKINFIMEDQKYFIEFGRYRYSTFKETEDLYKNKIYMDSYIVGLALSIYLWDTNRGLIRFFISKCANLNYGGHYLEIGPGHGEYFVTAMQHTGFDTYMAVDISEICVAIAKRYCSYSLNNMDKHYEIICKDFFDFQENKQFNAVVMGEVLEHVENPLAFLQKIYNMATDDAFIYITTAINAPQPDHIYHFNTIEDVRDLFDRSGLEVVDYIALTANNVSMDRAIKKKYAIVVGFVLKKLQSI